VTFPRLALTPILFFAASLPAAQLTLPLAISSVFRFGGGSEQIGGSGFDSAGNLLIAGTAQQTLPGSNVSLIGSPSQYPSHVFVAKINVSSQAPVWITEITGSGQEYIRGVTVTPSGAVIVAGTSYSPDFPTTPGAPFPAGGYSGGGFILKVDPTGKLVYSTYLGDATADQGAAALAVDGDGSAFVVHSDNVVTKLSPTGTILTSWFANGTLETLALDGSGNIVIAGTTCASSLLLASSPPPAGTSSCPATSFWLKVNPSGSMLFSVPLASISTPYTIAVDASGNSYLAGSSAKPALIVTKLSPNGSAVYSSILTGSAAPSSMRILADGTVVIGGTASPPNFQTLDTLQPCAQDLPDQTSYTVSQDSSGFIATFDPGGKLTLSTLVTGNGVTWVSGLASAPDGSLYVGGTTNASDFPGKNILSATLPGDIFIFKLDLNTIPHDAPAPACVVNGASLLPTPVSPGMIATLFGSNLGPDQGVSYTLDQNGLVPSQLAGTRITVNGINAPILYAQSGQVNFIMPRAVTGTNTSICASGANGSGCISSVLLAASPGIFNLPAGAAIFNPDWTYNNQTNPAPSGSYVIILGTGFGPYNTSIPDGSVIPANAIIWETLPTYASFSHCTPFPGGGICQNTQSSFQFAGAAPTFINGVDQVNLRIPANLTANLYSVSIWFLPDGPATALGTGATIWVQ
jgi:uncharacterized protein (TIGR03437 family)